MINNILKFLGQSVYYLTLNSNKNAPKAWTVQVWQFSDLKLELSIKSATPLPLSLNKVWMNKLTDTV